MKPRALIACEYSGIVRSAFTNKGWDAWSCDILPTEIPGQHLQCNVLDILNNDWDLMIAFPPCTFLTYAGMAHWYNEGRAMKRIKAAEFFMSLYESAIDYICIENPQGIMSKIFREPDMTIHPYYFGDRELKRTCLWLKGLPKLQYTLYNDLFHTKTATDKPLPTQIQYRKKTGKIKNRYFTDSISNNKFKTGLQKSKTFPGIANAMADQWTEYIINQSQ